MKPKTPFFKIPVWKNNKMAKLMKVKSKRALAYNMNPFLRVLSDYPTLALPKPVALIVSLTSHAG